MLHPSVRLLSWGAIAGLTQTLGGLGLLTAASACVALGIVAAPARFRALVWRVRWLLISILVLFCCATPGEVLLPWLGGLSPTTEGIRLAGEHGARLIALMALLAVLLQLTPPAALISGFFGILRPLESMGISRERLALRLMLVMRNVEEREEMGVPSNWRQWLAVPEASPNAESRFSVEVSHLGVLDLATLAGILTGTAILAMT